MSVHAELLRPRRVRFDARRLQGISSWLGPVWVWAILAALLVYGFYVIPDFFGWGNFSNILRQGVPLAVVGIGQTLVILTGGIDISVASVVSMGNTLAMGLMNGHEPHVWYALLLPCLAGLMVGIVNGVIVAVARVPAFIVTLGSASAVQGIVFAYTHYNTYGNAAPSIADFGFTDWGPFPALVVLFAPVVVLMLIVQHRSRGLRHLYAVGGDESAARLAGISVRRVKIGAYAACGFFAALAGVVLTTRTGGGEPLIGTGYDWNSIAAVVIGGTLLRGGKGGIAGTMVAVLLLTTLSNAMDLSNVNSFWTDLVQGLIVMAAVGTAAVVALHPVEAWRARRADEQRELGDGLGPEPPVASEGSAGPEFGADQQQGRS